MAQRDYKTITDIKQEFEDGLENAPGIQELVYLIPISYILTEALPSAVGTTSASLVTISTNHVLKPAKAAILTTPIYNKSGVIWKLSGEELSKLFETDLTLGVPQVSAAQAGGAVAMKNMRYIALVRRPGQLVGFWQIGSKAMPLKVQDIAGGFGTGPTGEVGFTFTLKAFDVAAIYEYTGELPVPAP
jgi:hypothetical protein